MGDPTTDVLKPLIDAAKEAGCEYFCVDCGWYSDGHWWDGVGEWLPSKKRFPGGIEEVIQYIRSRDMIPGLWLELEVMGTKCPMVDKVPKDWFFQRNGQAVIDHCRYQLDFRNPQVQEYAMGVIGRLVEEYGVGYIKMDYNIDCGVGTDRDTDSAGAGLLEHNRAYLAWLDRVFETYPDLDHRKLQQRRHADGVFHAFPTEYPVCHGSDRLYQDGSHCSKLRYSLCAGTGSDLVLSAHPGNRGGGGLQHGKCHAPAHPPEWVPGTDRRGQDAPGDGWDSLL